MARNVKWRACEFKPTDNQVAGHSWFARPVIDQVISSNEAAAMIAARCGFKKFEAQGVLAAFAEVIKEQLLQSNAVQLADEDGNTVVTIQPDCSGQVSDQTIEKETTAANQKDAKVPIRKVSEEQDLTADRVSWTVKASIGVNFSRQFQQEKRARKVNAQGVSVNENDNDDQSQGGSGSGQQPGTGGAPSLD